MEINNEKLVEILENIIIETYYNEESNTLLVEYYVEGNPLPIHKVTIENAIE